MTKVKVGADPFPPFQYYDQNGNLKGSDYQLINNILLEIDVMPVYELDDWSVIEEKLIQGELDVAFQVQKTPEREAKYFFSEVFRNAVSSIVGRCDQRFPTDVASTEANGEKIAVISGYKYGAIVDDIRADNKVFKSSQSEVLLAVKNKEADFGVVDLEVFRFQDEEKFTGSIQVFEELNFGRPLHVVFHNEDLRDRFDVALRNEIVVSQ